MRRLDPISAALEIVATRFPDAEVTFLAGSVMRGEGTETSDLDLVVVYEKLEAAYRESFLHGDWPVEAFVHDPDTLRYFFFKENRVAGVPSLCHMVSSGVPLPRETDFSKSLQGLAEEVIAGGPSRWSEAEILASRYSITNLVDDLRSPRSPAELMATGAQLYPAVADHFLRTQGLWSAKGKSIPRHLGFVAPEFAKRFVDAFEDLFARCRTEAVVQLCGEVLSACGGWLFAGYKAVAPADWKLPADVPAHVVSNSTVSIHVVRPETASLLDRVNDDVFDHEVQPGLLRAFLANPANVLVVAIAEGEVVGMATGMAYVHPDKPLSLFINEVGVSARFHRRGIGQQLMLAILGCGKRLGCSEAWVATEVGNAPARALYRSCGGIEDEESAVVYVYLLAGDAALERSGGD